MKREQRLLIGKQLREGSLSDPDCMKKYGVGHTCVCHWRGYEESAGLECQVIAEVSSRWPIQALCREMFVDFRIGDAEDSPPRSRAMSSSSMKNAPCAAWDT